MGSSCSIPGMGYLLYIVFEREDGWQTAYVHKCMFAQVGNSRGPPGPSSRPFRLGASGRQRQKGRMYDQLPLPFSKISAACYKSISCQCSVNRRRESYLPKDRQELCPVPTAPSASKDGSLSVRRDIVDLDGQDRIGAGVWAGDREGSPQRNCLESPYTSTASWSGMERRQIREEK